MLAALILAPLLVFRGNAALLEDVYRSYLDLPASAKANPSNARAVATRLASFLHRAGYALATVRARAEGEQIVVDIDEGRLDKVIFLGGGAFETLRLRFDLNIQHDVFNQPDLERQLAAMARRLGLGEFAYEIVPVPNVAAPKLQLDDFDPIERISLGVVRPGRPYELHILVQPGRFRPGISPQLDIDSVEGGALGATYYSGRLLFPEDRWKVDGRIAGALRQKLDGSGSQFSFTRATGEASYEAPPLAGVVRPSLRASAALSDRQRPDLHLESFMFATLNGGVYLLFLPIAHIRTSLGGGVERRLLYSLEPVRGQTPVFAPSTRFAQTRPYMDVSLDLTFDPESIRRDRHHQLGFDARAYGPPQTGDDGALHIRGWYQKMFAFGWNELWLELQAVSRTGFVLFPEEISIGGGNFLRGPFGSEYTRKAAGVQLEYRYSLLRDVLKVGLFHNAVLYGAIDRVSEKDRLSYANAVGLGLHLLLIDEFQLDAWYGVGWNRAGTFDKGAALVIRQAF
jgi:hypothetical protein